MPTSCNIQFQRSLLPWKTKQQHNNCSKEKPNTCHHTYLLQRSCHDTSSHAVLCLKFGPAFGNVLVASSVVSSNTWIRSASKSPMVAIMEILPCLSSTERRRLKTATSPSAVNPAGSQNPTGAWTPSSFSNAVRVTWHENGVSTALLHLAALLLFLLVFWKKWRLWRGQDHDDIITLITVNTTILISWLRLWTVHGSGDDHDV